MSPELSHLIRSILDRKSFIEKPIESNSTESSLLMENFIIENRFLFSFHACKRLDNFRELGKLGNDTCS